MSTHAWSWDYGGRRKGMETKKKKGMEAKEE